MSELRTRAQAVFGRLARRYPAPRPALDYSDAWGLLVATVLIGYLVLNPDIMADVKMAVPFHPVATVLQ